MPERIARWRGIVLTVVIVVAVGYLVAVGELGSYIHPRYFVFTAVVCAVAGLLCVGAWIVLPRATADDDAHDHAHDHDPAHDHDRGPGRGRVRRRLALVWTLLVVAGLVTVMALPPEALTAETAATRAGDPAAGVGGRSLDLTRLDTADFSSFTLRDWASLLAQGATPSYLAGRTADVEGFVMPDPDGSPDVLQLTRLAITCCAVDAQPVSIAVHVPGWASLYHQGDWLSVTGGFTANPDARSAERVVLEPSAVEPVPEPAEPYAY